MAPMAGRDRAFLQRASTTDQGSALRDPLGDASWDPRNYMGFANVDYMPTKLVRRSTQDRSDDWSPISTTPTRRRSPSEPLGAHGRQSDCRRRKLTRRSVPNAGCVGKTGRDLTAPAGENAFTMAGDQTLRRSCLPSF